jgi:O-antigen/teichoic acid export membrane protein
VALYRRAFFFSTGERYATIALNFVLISVISRILTPDEIGVSVIGTTIIALAETLRDSPSSYLVQRKELTRADTRTAFTIMLLISLLIAALLLAVGAWLGRALGQKELAPFLWVIAASLLPACLERPVMALLRRDMEFATYAFINVTAMFATVALTISLALCGFSYMCFAWGLLGGTLVAAMLALCCRPFFWIFRPLLSEWRKVLPFNIYGGTSGLLIAINDVVPYAILGRSAQFDAVGYFNRAMTLCRLPDKLNAGLISLALPAFSTVVREGGNLAKAYLRALELVTVIDWPLRILLALFADAAVRLILGPQWAPVVPALQIMSVGFLLSTPLVLAYPILVAAGGIRDTLTINLICLPLSVLALGLGALHGLNGMALAIFLIAPLQTGVTLIYIRRRVAMQWRDLTLAVQKSMIVSLWSAAGPVALVLLSGGRPESSLALSALMGIAAAGGWLIGIRTTKHPICIELDHAREVLLSRIPRLRGSRPETR